MTPSIRSRLLFRVIGGMAVLLAVLSFVVYGVMYRSLLSDFDAVTVSTARTIAASVEQSDEKTKIEVDESEMPEFRRNDRPDYFQLWRDDGTVLVRSASLKEEDLGFFGGSSAPEFRTITLPDGRVGRAIGLVIIPRTDEETGSVSRPRSVTLVLARGTAAIDSEIRFLRLLLISATGGSIGLAFLLGAAVVRQGLAPLEELASRIAAIRQDELATKIPSDGMPVEIVPVAQRLNDLLVRLEEAFRRELTFTADAAHELRTPLAGIRSILEVSLSRPRAGKEYQQAMEECLNIVRHTQVLADGLLSLARLDAGQTQIHLERVVLAEAITSRWQPFADSARARGISVELGDSTDAHCMADRETLHMILGNIFANAVEYTEDGGSIEITTALIGNTMELTVANTGCLLSKEESRDVFERFWRGDASRTNTGTHCGLGLSLVKRAVTSLGGTVDASVLDGRFSIRLRIPQRLNADAQRKVHNEL